MKKNYLMILMVPIIITSAVLLPISVDSQDLTEAQRQERCQNNKTRIAEIETELKAIDAELSRTMSKKEIEDKRTQMVFVERMKNFTYKGYREWGYQKDSWDKLSRIASQYNFNFGACFDSNSDGKVNEYGESDAYFATLICLKKLKDTIASLIDQAEALNRPEILAKKNDIDKQLAFHRNNLVALGCDQISDTKTYDPKSVAGTWNWSFAPAGKNLEKHGTVTFQKTGENSGTVSWSGGSQGHWTQSGQSVTITWENNPSQDIMTLSADGHNLSGANNKGWPVEGTRGMK